MTWMTISPVDVWLFRDGKPFSAGEDSSAQSMFPPTPLTVQGALRRQISEGLGVTYREYRSGSKKDPTQRAQQAIDYIGPLSETLDTRAFRMRGPFVCVTTPEGRVERLYRCPADLLGTKESGPNYITYPYDLDAVTDLNNNVTPPYADHNADTFERYWLSVSGMRKYLAGDAENLTFAYPYEDRHPRYTDVTAALEDGVDVLHDSLLYQPEDRFGVSTDSQTSFREEGLLYRVQFVRPAHNVALLADVDGEHPPDLVTGQITLGGEHRHAFVQEVATQPMHIEPPDRIEGRFKIVFQTPAYFSGGWQPEKTDWSTLFGTAVTFKGASLYPPTKIGGWNSYNNAPRAMHNYATPGSVYYFEAAQPIAPPPSVTENPPNIHDAARIGFGQVVYGTW